MAKYIKNDSGAVDIWLSQQLADAEIYVLQYGEVIKWAEQARLTTSKIKTDILSGDLKVSDDNFATTMSAVDGLAFIQSNSADFILSIPVDDTLKSNRRQLSYKTSTGQLEYNEPLYDAVVAPSGADYTLPSAAFAAGHKRVFMQQGIYMETADVVVPDKGLLEAEAGTIIDFANGAFNVTVDGNGGTKYTTGTVAITSGSTAVVGTGTLFLSNVSAGQYLGLGPDFYKIASVIDDTNLVLENPWNGPTRPTLGTFITSMFSDIVIRGFRIKDSTDANGALFLRGVTTSLIQGIVICGSTHNYKIADSANVITSEVMSHDSTNDGCTISSSRSLSFTESHFFGNGGWGVEVTGGLAHKFSNCEFSSNIIGGANVTGSATDVVFNGSGSKQNAGIGYNTDIGTIRCIIADSTIEFNGSYGIDFDGSQNIISNCQIGNNVTAGVRGGAKGIVTNCHIHNNAGVGVEMNGDSETIIANNVIASNTGDGIDLSSTNDDVTIRNNQFISNGGWGIDIASSTLRARLGGNNYKSNTSGDINNLSATTNLDITNQAAEITLLTEKTTPVNGDWVIIEDSAAGNVKKKVQAGNLPSSGSVFGTGYAFAEILAVNTTTSSTYVQRLRLTTASLPAGDYRIGWSAGQGTDKVTATVFHRIQVDDTTTLVDRGGEYSSNNSDDFYTVAGFAKITLGAGVHNIDFDHKTESGTGVGSRIKDVRLEIWRVS